MVGSVRSVPISISLYMHVHYMFLYDFIHVYIFRIVNDFLIDTVCNNRYCINSERVASLREWCTWSDYVPVTTIHDIAFLIATLRNWNIVAALCDLGTVRVHAMWYRLRFLCCFGVEKLRRQLRSVYDFLPGDHMTCTIVHMCKVTWSISIYLYVRWHGLSVYNTTNTYSVSWDHNPGVVIYRSLKQNPDYLYPW